MWPFTRIPTKEIFNDYKTVKINGWRFVIRKVNPLIDLKSDNIPQIFTSFISKRPQTDSKPHETTLKKFEESMKSMIEAAVIEPELVPVGKAEKHGKEGGITVEDLMRDPETFTKLYWKIWAYSLNRFKGLKGFFTSLKIKYWLYILLRKDMENFQVKQFLNPINSR